MNKKALIGILAVLAVIIAAASILAVMPVAAKDKTKGKGKVKIEWSQPRVQARANKGEVVQTTVTLTPTADITNASFRLSASLRDTVTIDPPTFALLTAGTPYQIKVTFTAPTEGKRRKYHGVAALVDDAKLYAKPLKLRFGVEKAK